MIIKDGIENLRTNLYKQCSMYFDLFDIQIINDELENALARVEKILNCITRNNSYVWEAGESPIFSPYHTGQYSIFLYFMANCIYQKYGRVKEADILYYLNKIMHACDWYYEIELPEIFFVEHGVGSVMGRAKYGRHFHFYQGTTVGGEYDEAGVVHYPVVGDNVRMYANSSIVGSCIIGNNVIIAVDCLIRNENIPDNCIVFGKSPNILLKSYETSHIRKMMMDIWDNFD